MRAPRIIPVLLFALAVPATAGLASESPGQQSSSCESLITEAILAVEHLKPGATREQIEREFQMDGGWQTPQETHYDYIKCKYIKIYVHFKIVGPSTPTGPSPKDVATSISKPYLEYPQMD